MVCGLVRAMPDVAEGAKQGAVPLLAASAAGDAASVKLIIDIGIVIRLTYLALWPG